MTTGVPVIAPRVLNIIVAFYVVYVGICARLIAQKHGKNPLLYGFLAIISPLNLIVLGIWAFGKFERQDDK